MLLSNLRRQPHLSASALNDYIECGLAYKFGRIDKLSPELKSDSLEFGSTIHRVLEQFYSERMIGQILSLLEVHQAFEDAWHKAAFNRDDIRYAEGADYESLLVTGKGILTAWHEKLSDDEFAILAIEEPFSFTIQDVPVPLIGSMDLVLEDESGTIIITDFKTSSKSYSKDEVDQNQQLTVYQMAAKKNGYADREILLRFDTLIKTKTPKFEQYWTTRTPTDEIRLIRKAQSVWQGISKGVFVPNDLSWKCKNCGFKGACDQYLGGAP